MSLNEIPLMGEGGLWIFVEQRGGHAARVSLELLGRGREMAENSGMVVSAVLIGYDVSELAEELFSYGADRVVIVDDPVAKEYRTEVYTDALCRVCRAGKPEILFIGASEIGRDMAPRVAARLRTGCAADCTELSIDRESGLLIATKPYFGRSVMGDIVCPKHRPQIATVRPGVMEPPAPDRKRKGELIHADIGLDEADVRVKITDTVVSAEEGVPLEQAEKVVAGGMGAGDAAGFDMIKELAALLGAEVGCTSLPVDAGWISHDRLIGQTGKTIRPRLYIGCGISGAIQHSAGMINSEIIVAINNNPNAEIFGFADYGINGDIKKIVPAIIEELKKME